MRLYAKDKERYFARISKLKNGPLLNELLDVMQPDDYDDCFTSSGQWYKDAAFKEFVRRLKRCGFLARNWVEK